MTKAIVSYPESQRKALVARRVEKNTGGLGYLAALDAQNALIRKEIVKNLPAPESAEKA
jgi:hypothetical protein